MTVGGMEFWVWFYFGGGGASLKFRQFRSAVFDALGYFTCAPCGVFTHV